MTNLRVFELTLLELRACIKKGTEVVFGNDEELEMEMLKDCAMMGRHIVEQGEATSEEVYEMAMEILKNTYKTRKLKKYAREFAMMDD